MLVTNYIYDGNQYLAEADENDTINRLYTNEPDTYTHLISQEDVFSGDSLYYHFDAVGSTREVTEDTETVTDEFTYDAWGNRLSRTGTSDIPFQFLGENGYYRNDDDESYYVMARTYEPSIVRWMSVDPAGFNADDVNLYRYVKNNPMLWGDPSGLDPLGKCVQDCQAWYSACWVATVSITALGCWRSCRPLCILGPHACAACIAACVAVIAIGVGVCYLERETCIRDCHIKFGRGGGALACLPPDDRMPTVI